MRFAALIILSFFVNFPVSASYQPEVEEDSALNSKRQERNFKIISLSHGYFTVKECQVDNGEEEISSASALDDRQGPSWSTSVVIPEIDWLSIAKQMLELSFAETLKEYPSEEKSLKEQEFRLLNDAFIYKLAQSLRNSSSQRPIDSLIDPVFWSQSLSHRLNLMKQTVKPFIPIFALGPHRSGTTLIGNHIGSSSKVCNLIEYPGFYLASKIGPSFQRKVDAAYKPELYNAMFDFVTLFITELVKRESCEAYIDSNPFNFRIIKKLQEKINPALFIVMLRDYRGIITSLEKSYKEGRSWAGANDLERATLYYKFYKRLKNIDLNRVIFLNYDQLCEKPNETLDTFEHQFYDKLRTLFNVHNPEEEWHFDRRLLCENQAPTYLNSSSDLGFNLPRSFKGTVNNEGIFTLSPIVSYNSNEWSSVRDEAVCGEVSKVVKDLEEKIPHLVRKLKETNPAFAAFYKTLEELKNKYKGKEVVSINSYRSFGGIEQGLNTRPWQALLEAPMHNKFPDRINFLEATPEGSTKSYLTLLWEALHQGTTVTLSNGALVGMGGVGKTSLALAYAYEALEHKAYDFIYWLPSETLQHLLEGYKNILKKLNVDLKGNETEEDLVDLVNQELPNKTKKWLLIYDNVPNPEFLQEKAPQVRGHILITSRYQDEWPNKIFYLDVFNPNDAVAYLLKALALKDITENQEQVRQLAEELGNFPLALSHAASFIQVKSKRRHYSIETYLQDFKKQPETLLSQPLRFNKKSQVSYENLVAKTLRMAGKYISPLARELLIYFAYLDPDHLVGDFFLRRAQDESQLEDALDELVSFSIIKKSPESISIHRLVQLVIRTEQEKGEALKALPMHLNNLMSNLVSYWQDNLYQSIREKGALLEEEELSVLEALHNKASTLQAHLIKLYQHFQQATVANKLEEDLLINLKMGNLLLQRVLNEDFGILQSTMLKKMQNSKDSFQSLSLMILQDELKSIGIEVNEDNINCFLMFLNQSPSKEDRIYIWRALAQVEPSRLQDFINMAEPLITEDMDGLHRALIIKTIARVDPLQRQLFIEGARSLMTADMSYYVRLEIIQALEGIEPHQFGKVIEGAKFLLFRKGKVWSGQSALIRTLAKVKSSHFQQVVEGAQSLITEDMDGMLRGWIIGTLANLKLLHVQEFIEALQSILNDSMKGMERADLIKKLGNAYYAENGH